MKKLILNFILILFINFQIYGNPLDISIWINKGNGAVYRQNESVEIYFRSNKDCYITLYAIDTEGYIQLLFPLNKFSNNFIKAEETYSVPNDWDYPKFKAHGPSGMIYIQAVATTAPQNLPDWPEYYKNIRDDNYRIFGDPYTEIDTLNSMISRIEPITEYYDSKSIYLYVNNNIKYSQNRYTRYSFNIHLGYYYDFYPYYDYIIFNRWNYPPRFVYWDWYRPYYVYNYNYIYYPDSWYILNYRTINIYNKKRYKNSYSNLIIKPKYYNYNLLSFEKKNRRPVLKKTNTKYYKTQKSKYVVHKTKKIIPKKYSYKTPQYNKTIKTNIIKNSSKRKSYIPNVYEKPKNKNFKINKNILSSSIKNSSKRKTSKITNFIYKTFKSATKNYITNKTKKYSSKYGLDSKRINKITPSKNKQSHKRASSYKSVNPKTNSSKSPRKIITKKKP